RRVGTRTVIATSAMGSPPARSDRKSTRLNSSHVAISYAVFCLKKKIIDHCVGSSTTVKRSPQVSDPTCFRNLIEYEDVFFFLNNTAATEIYPLSLHDALR